MQKELVIENLHVNINEIEILRGVDLRIPAGEIHALMGQNGSGKSTLANTLMGHPNYTVRKGGVWYGGKDLLEMSVDERAREGLFLAFQYPMEIPGVSLIQFLRQSSLAIRPDMPSLAEFNIMVDEAMDLLNMDRNYLRRSVNEGFSGGEKKKAEILQLMVLAPGFALLDETDSGLDIDALKIVAEGVNSMRGDSFSGLVITHYQRILDYLEPDMIHIMQHGQIALSGGKEIVKELEESGYAFVSGAAG